MADPTNAGPPKAEQDRSRGRGYQREPTIAVRQRTRGYPRPNP